MQRNRRNGVASRSQTRVSLLERARRVTFGGVCGPPASRQKRAARRGATSRSRATRKRANSWIVGSPDCICYIAVGGYVRPCVDGLVCRSLFYYFYLLPFVHRSLVTIWRSSPVNGRPQDEARSHLCYTASKKSVGDPSFGHLRLWGEDGVAVSSFLLSFFLLFLFSSISKCSGVRRSDHPTIFTKKR